MSDQQAEKSAVAAFSTANIGPARTVAFAVRTLPPPRRLALRGGSAGAARRWDCEQDGHSDLTRVLQPQVLSLACSPGPLRWPSPLRPFQVDGVSVLVQQEAVLLADDMGLGKTIQAAAAIRMLAFLGSLRAALVVAPASLLAQWQRELAAWAPELSTAVIRGTQAERLRLWRAEVAVRIVGYETFRGDTWPGSPAVSRDWDLVVLDEASRIKNPYANVTAACRRVSALRRWALTGTPLENVPGDVTSILRFLAPDAPPLATDTPGLIRARLQRVQVRRRKAEVLPELPPKHVIEVPIELTGAQQRTYERAERELIVELSRLGDRIHITTILELILRLKQICNADPVTGSSAKIDDLVWRVRQVVQAGHRALVFSQFTDSRYGVDRLARSLADLNPLCFTGALSLPERERVASQFSTDQEQPVMLLSLRAGGLGLNLQAASYVFHLDRWWNPAIEAQAEDRSHRLGQRWPVTVYRYLCTGTIEERIDELIRRKLGLFEEIVEPASLDPGRFTKAELLRLLRSG